LTTAGSRPAVPAWSAGDFYPMPGDTGLWLLERVRERGYPVPIIVVTGYADLRADELRKAPLG